MLERLALVLGLLYAGFLKYVIPSAWQTSSQSALIACSISAWLWHVKGSCYVNFSGSQFWRCLLGLLVAVSSINIQPKPDADTRKHNADKSVGR